MKQKIGKRQKRKPKNNYKTKGNKVYKGKKDNKKKSKDFLIKDMLQIQKVLNRKKHNKQKMQVLKRKKSF